MARNLPADCTRMILSLLSLDYFVKHNFTLAAWKQRFLCRYGDHIDDVKTYIIRAATEHYEVCALSCKYLDPDVVYYYAAKGKNWELLHQFILQEQSYYRRGMDYSEVMGPYNVDIFLLACKDKVAVGDDILCKCIEKMFNIVSHLIPRDTDFISNDAVCQIIYKRYLTTVTRPPSDPPPQMLRLLSFEDFVPLAQKMTMYKYDVPCFYDMNLYCRSRNDQAEVKRKIEYCEQLFGKDGPYYKLYHNQPLDTFDPDDILNWLNTSSITSDILLNIQEGVLSHDFYILRCNYHRIPDANTRAEEMLVLLEQFVLQNSILEEYIGVIKLITNTLTINDLHLVRNLDFIVVKMLDYHQYDLIVAFDIKATREYYLHNYIFKDVDQLKCILRCKNVRVQDCNYAFVLTSSLYKYVQEDCEIDVKIKLDIDKQWRSMTLNKN